MKTKFTDPRYIAGVLARHVERQQQGSFIELALGIYAVHVPPYGWSVSVNDNIRDGFRNLYDVLVFLDSDDSSEFRAVQPAEATR